MVNKDVQKSTNGKNVEIKQSGSQPTT